MRKKRCKRNNPPRSELDLNENVQPPSSSTGRSTYRRWIAYCAAGELVGFGGIPVVAGALAFWATVDMAPEPRALLLYAVAVVGGFGEGAVLAWFQLHVLRGVFPRIDARRWITATASAACFAWMLGYLAPTLDDLFDITISVQIAIWVPAGILILLSIGSAQAWVLRGIVEKPHRWVIANALGWLLGLPWTFALPALVPEDSPMAVWVATFVLAGVLMGLTVGVVTGFVLVRFAPCTASKRPSGGT
jgi:hypothetical protein